MPQRRRGSLLIVSLWLVAILSALAVATARFLSLEIRVTKYRESREQAFALARSGVFLAMQRLAEDTQEADHSTTDWLGDDWAYFPEQEDPTRWSVPFRAAGGEGGRLSGRVEIRITDEPRKLRLNVADQRDPAELRRLTGSDLAAQAIMDALDAPAPDVEDDPRMSPPYVAKNGPFAALEELNDLPGMTPEVYDILKANASPYVGATEPININTVEPDVLRAMGLSEAAVQEVLTFRNGPDGPDAHEQDGIFQAGTIAATIGNRIVLSDADDSILTNNFGVTSSVFTVVSTGIIQRPPTRATVTAVIRRAGCPDGVPSPCIVAWRQS